jgi:hypothetical protein
LNIRSDRIIIYHLLTAAKSSKTGKTVGTLERKRLMHEQKPTPGLPKRRPWNVKRSARRMVTTVALAALAALAAMAALAALAAMAALAALAAMAALAKARVGASGSHSAVGSMLLAGVNRSLYSDVSDSLISTLATHEME